MYKSLAISLPLIAVSLLIAAPVRAGDNGIAASIHTLRAEGGRVCQDGHFHVGTSPLYDNKDKAIRAATRHWSEFTVLEYGTDWGRFETAADRTTDCSKEVGAQWVCKVKARPCRAGLSTAAR